MGLKPIPQKHASMHKKTQHKQRKEQTQKQTQKKKDKGKGSGKEMSRDKDATIVNIRLSNDDITTLLANNPTPSEQHENTTKIIHNQTLEKLGGVFMLL